MRIGGHSVQYEVILDNGTVLTYEANSGNEAMNKAIKEDHITYDDMNTVQQA